jgi:hypothetical protein
MGIAAGSFAPLQRIADLLRRDDPALADLALEPDGRYQMAPTTLARLTREVTECLARGFRTRAADEFPMLYCAWGKAPVGSTALINLFGVAGQLAYFQPVKALLRNSLAGEAPEPWLPPLAADHPHLVSKDVAGPYLLAECF